MTTPFKYLHETTTGTLWIDHRVVPEVSGMLAAMSSRAPLGGVKARYAQIVEAVARGLYDEARDTRLNKRDFWPEWDQCQGKSNYECWTRDAEDRLCTYPLHPKVQKFFDDFVGKYGHSSILELVGGVAVFSEGISWLTAWLLFDSPLCSGQEFSTRAVQHKDWPMAKECNVTGPSVMQAVAVVNKDGTLQENPPFETWEPHPALRALHDDWFEVFEAEVAWWKAEFTSACPQCLGVGESLISAVMHNRVPVPRSANVCEKCQGTGKKYPTADKEPFRPALDRARWALPGTIATGCGHTSNLRERSRVIRDGSLLAQASGPGGDSAAQVWTDLTRAYKEALPGLMGMGLREAVYGSDSQIPGHLRDIFSDAPDGPDAEVECAYTGGLSDVRPFKRRGQKTYADPLANTLFRCDVTFRCSLAVARDWHRHRTMYPWHIQVVRGDGTITDLVKGTVTPGHIQIDHHYEPKSDLAREKTRGLLQRSTRVFDAFMADGNVVQAGLALPLGTRVRMRGQAGLRDTVYCLELRKFAHGANFEYLDQASQALVVLYRTMQETYAVQGETVADLLGLSHS